jgi:hypothetical protein
VLHIFNVFNPCNHLFSLLLFFLLCGKWLLSCRLVHLLVLLTSTPLVLFVLFSMIRCLEHVNGCNLLSDFQSCFSRGQSTETALVKDTEDLRLAKAEGKAFDLINHQLFVHKIGSRYDFHTSAMSMVSSIFRDRSMAVEVDGMKSTTWSVP